VVGRELHMICPWGRPSGARQGKRRKGRDAYSSHRKEGRRFEEIDSDTDDGEGVGLEGSLSSDDLLFTGADLGQRSRTRRGRDYEYISGSSDEEDDVMEKSGATMQLALRDKEDLLVEKALERILRAQMLGKTNVKLSQRELDALERKRRKDEAPRKISHSVLQPGDRRRTSGTSSPALREQKSRKKIRAASSPHDDRTSNPSRTGPPGLIVPGHDGPSYTPLGYYPPAVLHNRRSGGASPGSLGQQEVSPPLPQQPRTKGQSQRQSSGAMPSKHSPVLGTGPVARRLPDDPNWLPRPRSASSNQPYSMNPYQLQQHPQPPPQVPPRYAHNRRIVSGPPDVHYPEVQYLGTRRVAAHTQPFAASSGPSLLRREYSTLQPHEGSPSADDSGSSAEGVHVDVVPYDRGHEVNVGFEGSMGRQRRGQR